MAFGWFRIAMAYELVGLCRARNGATIDIIRQRVLMSMKALVCLS